MATLLKSLARLRRREVLLLTCGLLLGMLLLPEWVTSRRLSQQLRDTDEEISRLDVLRVTLTDERARLLNDPTYVERVAREEFRSTRQGEILLEFDEPPDDNAVSP